MNGRSAGPGGGIGFCGRPTSAVAHVPTHRSEPALCARASESSQTIASAIATRAATADPRRSCMSRAVMVLTAHLLVRGAKPGMPAAILQLARAYNHGSHAAL